MLVKCRCCGNKIDRDTAYKIIVGNRNNYYCNEQEYDNMIYEKQKDKELDQKILNQFYEILGYRTINTNLFKEIKEIESEIPKEKLYNYLFDNSDYIIKESKKDFKSEYARIRYIGAIIKNHIIDYSSSIREEVIKENEYVNDMPDEVKYKSKTKRKGFNNIEV